MTEAKIKEIKSQILSSEDKKADYIRLHDFGAANYEAGRIAGLKMALQLLDKK